VHLKYRSYIDVVYILFPQAHAPSNKYKETLQISKKINICHYGNEIIFLMIQILQYLGYIALVPRKFVQEESILTCIREVTVSKTSSNLHEGFRDFSQSSREFLG
jgi:hypothetical protein